MKLQAIFILILLLLPVVGSSKSIRSDNSASMLDIYNLGISQFENNLGFKGLKVDKVDMADIAPSKVEDFLGQEFGVNAFDGSNEYRGRVISLNYENGFFTEFGAYEVEFQNSKKLKKAIEYMDSIGRDYFRSKKKATMFSWFYGENSILIVFGDYNN
ncbi:hypothetical protein [Microbulbifer variabilis]|uniref:CAP-associated domain-containing protein n=1 Tax=Microbulbifer variabilis TaxID=266805 RepID=A0ABY4V882_9GAMM|nr:hypothetical protein [Microbulbifer variabilis]USD20486.1 hypothetical protein MJO52_15590 [Microbulbifer variabilis]